MVSSHYRLLRSRHIFLFLPQLERSIPYEDATSTASKELQEDMIKQHIAQLESSAMYGDISKWMKWVEVRQEVRWTDEE